nr:MAG TPA: hypothetical protein [Caudoviricetes sp.]
MGKGMKRSILSSSCVEYFYNHYKLYRYEENY